MDAEGEGAVKPGCGLVGVDDVHAVFPAEPRQLESHAEIEARLAPEAVYGSAFPSKLRRPEPRFIEADHEHGEVLAESLGHLHHETFRAAGIEAVDHVGEAGFWGRGGWSAFHRFPGKLVIGWVLV